jgi:hypothetical protein
VVVQILNSLVLVLVLERKLAEPEEKKIVTDPISIPTMLVAVQASHRPSARVL